MNRTSRDLREALTHQESDPAHELFLVDGVVLSILRDVSRMSKLLAAKDVLSSYKVPFLGAVVTGASKTEAYGNEAIRYYQEARVNTVV